MSNVDEINATAASLLGFLSEGPMTGWELDAAVEGSIANFWNVTRSQVYRELRTLAELGLAEAGDAGPRDRRPYSVTEAGREAFSAWIVRNPGSPIVRMPLLLTVFFGRHIPPQRLMEIVHTELEAGEEALVKYEAMHQAYAGDPFVSQVLQFGIDYQRTLLAWLQRLAADPAIQPQQTGHCSG
jgi:DNA-binding PadR family transcriptional regulator